MNRKYKVILGILFSLYFTTYLFSLMFLKKQQAHWHQRAIVAIASPMQHLVDFTYGKITSIFDHYVFLVYTEKHNEKLEKENQELKLEKIQGDEILLENERLRALLGLDVPHKFSAINAERIASNTNEFERSIRIDKGSKDGIRIGMPVVNPSGVIGQIAEIFPSYSSVLLLTDKSSAIEVLVQRTRARAILKGFTQHQLSFEFFSVDEDLQVGDIVVSSGLDGVYPEGIPVGVVSASGKTGRRLFITATVDPYVNFAKIEEVRVLSLKGKEEP